MKGFFLLNSVGNESRIFELDYDFQGLGETAILNLIETDVAIPKGRSHDYVRRIPNRSMHFK